MPTLKHSTRFMLARLDCSWRITTLSVAAQRAIIFWKMAENFPMS